MDEDRARNRKGNAAACLAVVRRLALNIAWMHPDKRSIRRKFLHAQRKQEFLIDMIAASAGRSSDRSQMRLPWGVWAYLLVE